MVSIFEHLHSTTVFSSDVENVVRVLVLVESSGAFTFGDALGASNDLFRNFFSEEPRSCERTRF